MHNLLSKERIILMSNEINTDNNIDTCLINDNTILIFFQIRNFIEEV